MESLLAINTEMVKTLKDINSNLKQLNENISSLKTDIHNLTGLNSTINVTMNNLCLTIECIGEKRTQERKDGNVVRSLNTILDQEGYFKVVITYVLCATLCVVKTRLQEYGRRT